MSPRSTTCRGSWPPISELLAELGTNFQAPHQGADDEGKRRLAGAARVTGKFPLPQVCPRLHRPVTDRGGAAVGEDHADSQRAARRRRAARVRVRVPRRPRRARRSAPTHRSTGGRSVPGAVSTTDSPARCVCPMGFWAWTASSNVTCTMPAWAWRQRSRAVNRRQIARSSICAGPLSLRPASRCRRAIRRRSPERIRKAWKGEVSVATAGVGGQPR